MDILEKINVTQIVNIITPTPLKNDTPIKLYINHKPIKTWIGVNSNADN
jgi:hypothetical protein